MSNGHHVQWTPLNAIVRNVQWTLCPLDITMSIGVQWCPLDPLDMMSIVHDVQWTWCPLDPMDNNTKMMLTHRFRLVILSIGSIWMDPMDTIGSNGHVHWTVQWCPLDPMDMMMSIGHFHRMKLLKYRTDLRARGTTLTSYESSNWLYITFPLLSSSINSIYSSDATCPETYTRSSIGSSPR